LVCFDLSGLFLFAFLAIAEDEYESNQYNLYEQWTFLEELYPDDIYENGLCLETGEAAYEQGEEQSTLYRAVNVCKHGQIDAVTVSGQSYINVAPRFPAAVQDLGPLSAVSSRYNITGIPQRDVFGSIHYESGLPKPGIVIAKSAMDFQPLMATDVNNLMATTQDSAVIQFAPVPGNLYLIRTSIGSVANWDGTDFYYKLLPIQVQPGLVSLRWSILYTATELEEDEELEELEEDIDEVETLATAGLVIAVIAMSLLSIDYCVRCCRWRREREYERNKPHSAAMETTPARYA